MQASASQAAGNVPYHTPTFQPRARAAIRRPRHFALEPLLPTSFLGLAPGERIVGLDESFQNHQCSFLESDAVTYVLVKVHLKQQAPYKFGPKFCIGMQYMHAWECMHLSKRFARGIILSQFKHVDSESDLDLEPFGQELRRF